MFKYILLDNMPKKKESKTCAQDLHLRTLKSVVYPSVVILKTAQITKFSTRSIDHVTNIIHAYNFDTGLYYGQCFHKQPNVSSTHGHIIYTLNFQSSSSRLSHVVARIPSILRRPIVFIPTKRMAHRRYISKM